jgi:hypothetical protein
VALSLEFQSTGILPFQSVLLRFPAIWPNASLRHGSGSVRRAPRYPLTVGVERPGPDLEDEPRMCSCCAIGVSRVHLHLGFLGRCVKAKDPHQDFWIERIGMVSGSKPEPGVTDQRAVGLGREAMVCSLETADYIESERGSTYSIRFI